MITFKIGVSNYYMFQLRQQKIKKEEGGFVIFIALITSTLILAISIGVLSISLKDYIFSGYTISSTQAFYAADSGLDCAVYYLTKVGLFPVPDATNPVSSFSASEKADYASQIKCGGEDAANNLDVVSSQSGNRISYTTTFKLKQNLCAEITVINSLDTNGTPANDADDKEWTIVRSRGWSSVDNGGTDRCAQDLGRRTERSLEFTFGNIPG